MLCVIWVLLASDPPKLELGDVTSIIPTQLLGLVISTLLVSTQSFEKIRKRDILHNHKHVVETTYFKPIGKEIDHSWTVQILNNERSKKQIMP